MRTTKLKKRWNEHLTVYQIGDTNEAESVSTRHFACYAWTQYSAEINCVLLLSLYIY